jgi:hypothetical protein
MADKDGVERKVWLLPAELSERIKAFQASQGISSEVEAARRLLDSALQMRDSVPDILRKLSDRYAEEKDLRVLARDVLVGHALVKSVSFDDSSAWFEFRDDTVGKIAKDGRTFIGEKQGYNEFSWERYPKPEERYTPRARPPSPSWEAPKSDLDDEIPF